MAGDEAEARSLSADIRRALGERRVEGVRWSDRVAVLWSLVQRDDNELRALGLWLLRATPEAAKEVFPPLVLRNAPPRAKAEPGPTDDEARPANTDATEQPAHDAEKPATDAKPVEVKPAEVKPTEVKPADAPAATKPRTVKAKPAAKKARARAR